MRTRSLGAIHPSNGLPPCRMETMGTESLRGCSHAPVSLHGDSSRVTGKQLTCDQDVSVFPSSAPSFFPSSGCDRKLVRKASSSPGLTHKKSVR